MATDATVKAMLNKINMSATGFVSSYGRYPNENEFFKALNVDETDQMDNDACNIDGAPDNECLFAVSGLELSKRCSSSGWKGEEGDFGSCNFRYKGGIQGQYDRFRVYVRAQGMPKTLFAFDNKEGSVIYHCPLTVTDEDNLADVCDFSDGSEHGNNGHHGGGGGHDGDGGGDDDVIPPEDAINITTESAPPGNLNEYYQALFYAEGGELPYLWSLVSGTLPPMTYLITEENVGKIQGTPTAYGDFNFTIQVYESSGSTFEKDFTVAVNLRDLEIVTENLPSGSEGESYRATIEGIGGQTPYTWTISMGSLQAGLTLSQNGNQAVISGIPTEGGSKSFTIMLSDAVGRTLTKAFTIDVEEAVEEYSDPVTKKVLLLIYEPKMLLGTPLVEDRGWYDYMDLTRQVIREFKRATGGYLNFEIAERKIVRDWPVKEDGFKYTRTKYNKCVNSGGSSCHYPDAADYLAMIEEVDACTKLNNGEIDELWIWGGPWFGFHSARLAGPGAYWVNSPPLSGTTCNSVLPIMGFNYERGLDSASWNFAFRVDSTMSLVFGSWERKETHAWNKFSMLNTDLRGRGGCGNAVSPVNSPSSWIFDSRNNVASRCDEFYNYPEVGDTFNQINCTQWGCDAPGYYEWWWKHIPRKDGTNYDTFAKKDILNNWWKYIFDFDWR